MCTKTLLQPHRPPSLILGHIWHTPTLQHLTRMPLPRILFSQRSARAPGPLLLQTSAQMSPCQRPTLTFSFQSVTWPTATSSLLTVLYFFTPSYLSSSPFFPYFMIYNCSCHLILYVLLTVFSINNFYVSFRRKHTIREK